jgi:hypothetical protein
MLNLSSETEYASKMAISVVVYLGLFMAVSCNSSELELKSNAQVVQTPIVQVNTTPKVKDELEQVAKRLTELHDNKNCKEFFNAFPNTFEEFDRLYGFDDEKGGRILYSKFPEHFSYFFDCPDVSAQEKLIKVIKIGVDGRWNDAVPIGVFEESAFDLIIDNPSKAREILDSLPDEKAASFWYFLFDRPHPTDKENKKRVDSLSSLLGKNSKQSKLLSEQYKKLVVDWSEH